jgi:hypothetical protein
MKQALKIFGSALGNETEFDGKYVKTYDPDHGEHGRLTVTADLQDAMHYEDAGAALEVWKAVNRNHPTRSDGKPNRPLTAFTVEMVNVP